MCFLVRIDHIELLGMKWGSSLFIYTSNKAFGDESKWFYFFISVSPSCDLITQRHRLGAGWTEGDGEVRCNSSYKATELLVRHTDIHKYSWFTGGDVVCPLSGGGWSWGAGHRCLHSFRSAGLFRPMCCWNLPLIIGHIDKDVCCLLEMSVRPSPDARSAKLKDPIATPVCARGNFCLSKCIHAILSCLYTASLHTQKTVLDQ